MSSMDSRTSQAQTRNKLQKKITYKDEMCLLLSFRHAGRRFIFILYLTYLIASPCFQPLYKANLISLYFSFMFIDDDISISFLISARKQFGKTWN